MQKLNRFFKIINYFLKSSSKDIALAMVLFIISQICLLISYFLPIKVLVLLSNKNIPASFNDLFFNIDREYIILILTLFVFIAYGSHYLFEAYSETIVHRIVKRMSNKKKKVDNSKDHLKSFEYKFVDSFIKTLAMSLLIFILFLLMTYLFPMVGFVTFLFFIFLFLILIKMKIEMDKSNKLFKLSSGVGFMIVFIFEVIDVLYLNPDVKDIFVIVIVLILARYIFTRSNTILNKAFFVYSSFGNFIKKQESR